MDTEAPDCDHAQHPSHLPAGGHRMAPSAAIQAATAPTGAAPPPRPGRLQEALAAALLRPLSPPLGSGRPVPPPPGLNPWWRFTIPGPRGLDHLPATWFPASREPRGAVLLAHPWIRGGQTYFYRRGRIPALRRAGFHVMTFDFGGLGAAAPRPPCLYDLDLTSALDALTARAEGLPAHLWGVSAGGYWAHTALSRRRDIRGAFFEDVPSHLFAWIERNAPRGRVAYWIFRQLLRTTYRFLDLRHHAPCLTHCRPGYLAGGKDLGIPVTESRELARLAGGRLYLVPEAGHLESLRLAPRQVLGSSLETLNRRSYAPQESSD